MMAYTKPQQKKKEESEKLRGERHQIKSTSLRFERWLAVRFGKAKKGKRYLKLHVLGMYDDLRDRCREVGSETWKGCE